MCLKYICTNESHNAAGPEDPYRNTYTKSIIILYGNACILTLLPSILGCLFKKEGT